MFERAAGPIRAVPYGFGMLHRRRLRPRMLLAALLAAALPAVAGCADVLADGDGSSPFTNPPFIERDPLTDALPTNPQPDPAQPPAPSPDAPQPPAPAPEDGPLAQVRALWAELEVKGRAPKTGYSRAEFGQRWSDDVPVALGHNGCDTRNDILRRDLVDVAFKPGTRDCVVVSGTLHDPFTGRTIDFVRGNDTSREVQIDHVVALSDAWQKGAQGLDPDARRAFSNDPLNLLAVDGSSNQAKGDGDAATWLPPNSSFRCRYVARQTVVKHRYGLWATPAEHEALGRWLDTCAPEDDAALAALVEGAEASPR